MENKNAKFEATENFRNTNDLENWIRAWEEEFSRYVHKNYESVKGLRRRSEYGW